MTRWVRSGSSQKHKKMPGDATKWGEFDNQYARQIPPKKKKNITSQINHKQKLKSSQSDYPSSKTKMQLDEDRDKNKISDQQNCAENESHFDAKSPFINNEVNSTNFLTNKTCQPKKKKKQKNFNIKCSSLDEKISETDECEIPYRHKKVKLENDFSITAESNKISKQGDIISSNDFVKSNECAEEAYSQQNDKNKRKKKKKRNKCSKVDSESSSVNDEVTETSLSNNISFDNCNESFSMEQDIECINSSSETSEADKSQDTNKTYKKQNMKKYIKINRDSNQSAAINENCKNSPSKIFQSKKEKYLKKLQKKREKLGLLLLPPNVERKLYKIKKRLIEKGFPPEKQKEILREARRKEELKYRKVFNPSKLCFGCREAGHILADCQKKTESLKQETGICFKCGSVEHTSFKCPEKVQGYPYAKCFICKEQGHISRDCPKNKHGVYPKGGRCKLCGNVNHLKKDCPTLKKKKEDEEETITLHTLSEDASIDAEIVKREETEKKTKKKAKIVKF